MASSKIQFVELGSKAASKVGSDPTEICLPKKCHWLTMGQESSSRVMLKISQGEGGSFFVTYSAIKAFKMVVKSHLKHKGRSGVLLYRSSPDGGHFLWYSKIPVLEADILVKVLWSKLHIFGRNLKFCCQGKTDPASHMFCMPLVAPVVNVMVEHLPGVGHKTKPFRVTLQTVSGAPIGNPSWCFHCSIMSVLLFTCKRVLLLRDLGP